MEIFKNTRGGQANRKSANSWPHSDIANPQLEFRCASPQIENPQIFMIYLQTRKFLQNTALLYGAAVYFFLADDDLQQREWIFCSSVMGQKV